MRIGIGYDSHRFSEAGDQVMIGGVSIPHSQGVLAHSDGDVLLHALCDALLGSLALGDIGRHFPDTDARFKGCSSLSLLQHVAQLIVEKGYVVSNVDAVIICEQPKLAPHIELMRERIATVLTVATEHISVKATTNERMGFTGRGEGLAAQVVVCVTSR
jgi:2-C-methyl-D-erythritol 2,4-cyclodiphosphate synthase